MFRLFLFMILILALLYVDKSVISKDGYGYTRFVWIPQRARAEMKAHSTRASGRLPATNYRQGRTARPGMFLCRLLSVVMNQFPSLVSTHVIPNRS